MSKIVIVSLNWNGFHHLKYFLPSVRLIDYDNYELTEYRIILKDQLENGKPILYSGFSDEYGNGGHAWNIDGYQNNNMHCNWGWGGWNNGYFNLVTMNGFDTWQNALLNIIPDNLTVGKTNIL